MAEEKENQSSEEVKEKSGNKLLLVIIIVLLLILLIIGGLVAYFLLFNNSDNNQPTGEKKEIVKKTNALAEIGPIYPLDQFIVNLASNNADRYLKCKISLELSMPELQQEIDKKLPAIRDIIISILSSKSVEEIQTIRGKNKLKEEIKRKINEILTSGEIKNVYFTEFVIQ